jgi:hypothetical protein
MGKDLTEKRICEIESCDNPARYQIYKILPDGSKVWLSVCEYHEKKIDDENMRRAMKAVSNG